jgi:transposase-like protein
MSKHNQHPFTWRHFQADIILLCVRWYLRYSLSYRDLEEIMLERGLHVDHTTMVLSALRTQKRINVPWNADDLLSLAMRPLVAVLARRQVD